MSIEHQVRVEQFCQDLRKLPLSLVTQKHITTGKPVLLSDDDYFDLRREVAGHFSLHPTSVILVGSTRTGFSIAPKKRFVEASPDSDLDLAVVSTTRFDHYWDIVHRYAESDLAWKKSPEFKIFMKNLFHGWIDPRALPNPSQFVEAQTWMEFFDNLMSSRRFGTKRITARLYRTWERLEAYQQRALRKCSVSLENAHV